MQNQRNVERALGCLRGFFAVQHQQKIRGVRKRLVGFYDCLPFSNTIVAGDDHGNLRGQPNRFANVGLMIVAALIGVVEGKCGNGRTQHVHGYDLLGRGPQHSNDRGVKLAFLGEARANFF